MSWERPDDPVDDWSAAVTPRAADRKTPESITALATVALAVATFANSILVGCQFSVMRAQLSEMQSAGHQADRMIDTADRTAKASEQSAAQARAALDATIESNRLDQRAWIAIETLTTPPVKVGEQLQIEIAYRNSGRTPATNVTSLMRIEPVRPGGRVLFTYEDIPKTSVGFVGPSGAQVNRLGAGRTRTAGSMFLFNEDDLRDLLNGRVHYFTHGEIDYSDIFGRQHWLTFCFQLQIAAATVRPLWEACSDHNATGDK